MVSYLQRYQQGEYVRVWAELSALGARVREESVYSDALAVAHETMSRTRRNIEVLIPRLEQIGYEFGSGLGAGFGSEAQQNLHQIAPIFAPPQDGVALCLEELEREFGSLPLSLSAFYEVVGSVNLVGSNPNWNNLRPEGMADIEEFVKTHPTFDWRNYDLDHGLDPLFVWSIDIVFEMLHTMQELAQAVGEDSEPYYVDIAPDYLAKYGMSGSGPYRIKLPSPGADAPIEDEWHNTTFVDYLRVSFRWGGMPGLERCSKPPLEDLAFLTEGLLPI